MSSFLCHRAGVTLFALSAMDQPSVFRSQALLPFSLSFPSLFYRPANPLPHLLYVTLPPPPPPQTNLLLAFFISSPLHPLLVYFHSASYVFSFGHILVVSLCWCITFTLIVNLFSSFWLRLSNHIHHYDGRTRLNRLDLPLQLRLFCSWLPLFYLIIPYFGSYLR